MWWAAAVSSIHQVGQVDLVHRLGPAGCSDTFMPDCKRFYAWKGKCRSGSVSQCRKWTAKKTKGIGIWGVVCFSDPRPQELKVKLTIRGSVFNADPYFYWIFRNRWTAAQRVCVSQWNRSPGRTVWGCIPLGTGARPSQNAVWEFFLAEMAHFTRAVWYPMVQMERYTPMHQAGQNRAKSGLYDDVMERSGMSNNSNILQLQVLHNI